MLIPRPGVVRAAVLVGGLVLAAPASAAERPDLTAAYQAILAVGPEGTGNEAAAAAWKTIATAGPDALLPTLRQFDTARPTAANWLRSAVDALVEDTRRAGKPLPVADLTTFLTEAGADGIPRRNPAARRIAFELILAADKAAADRLLRTFINDPSPDLRRDAIAARLKALPEPPGEAGQKELRTLFAAARDKDQVEELAQKLTELGEKPDLTRHFGFVTEWLIIGPFDGSGDTRLTRPYPPEAGFEAAAKYQGKDGATVTWRPAQSRDTMGKVDLNGPLGEVKNAVGYAYAVLEIEKETPAEVRVSSPNAVQIFVNRQKVFERDEYHHGASFDQYRGACVLKPGRNEILIKVVQNDQTQDYAKVWQFAARVCDGTGGPLPLQQVILRDGKEQTVTPGALAPAEKKEGK